MTAVWTLLAGMALAAAAWTWASRSIDGSARVAIVAVLGVTAAAFNIVVPVPSIEATTTVVVCTSIALGARTGIAAGLVAIVASSVTGGIGVWTIWMVVAAALVACLAAVAGRAAGRVDWFTPRGAVTLAATSVVATLVWDVVTTAGSAASYATQSGLTPTEQVVSALLIGAMFTVTHVVFTTAFTLVGGPPLLHALERARPRLAGGVIA